MFMFMFCLHKKYFSNLSCLWRRHYIIVQARICKLKICDWAHFLHKHPFLLFIQGSIMAGSRSVEGGETKWSKCSAEKLKRFNKECVYEQGIPDEEEEDEDFRQLQLLANMTAAEQCQLFLGDKAAVVVNNFCSSLLCSSNQV